VILQSRITLRIPPATACLIILQIILWVMHPILAGGIGCNACISQGEWWRLITSLFIHYNVQHLIGNSLCFLAIGSYLEHQLSKWRFLFIFFTAGIAGNILTLFVMPSDFIHTGASGAIFGMLGVQLYVFYAERHRHTAREQFIILVALCIMVITTFFGPNTNAISHLGGLLAGGLCAPFLYKG
jgi:rhomboid protease GluP